MFLSNLAQIGRFDSRKLLIEQDAVTAAIQAAFDGGVQTDLARDELLRDAYKLKRTEPRMALIQNPPANGNGVHPRGDSDG